MDFFSNIFKGLGNLVQPIMSMFGGGGGQPQNIGGGNSTYGMNNIPQGMKPPATSGVGGNIGGNFMQSLFPGGTGQGVAGIAAPLIGNMFAPKVKTPDISNLSSVNAMRNFRPGNSVSPEYQTMIQNNVKQLRDQRKREIDAVYHSTRPGTDYTTDTNYQRDIANLDQSTQDNLTDELAKAEGTFSGQEQDRLAQIAQNDIAQIMLQTGLDAQEANDFKQMFSNVGNMFLTNATRKQNQFDLSSLFGR